MASKNSKVATSKSPTHKVKLALSSECENCTCQCAKGLEYMKRLKSGKTGNGVVCKK